MNFLHEYALLFAVAAPVAVILGANLLLALGGESGTLLLPQVGALRTAPGAIRVDATPPLEAGRADREAANDSADRLAA